MWSDALGWLGSLILLILMAARTRRLSMGTPGPSRTCLSLAGYATAFCGIALLSYRCGGFAFFGTSVLLATNALLLALPVRAPRMRKIVELRAANDDHEQMKLRMLSGLLLENREHP